MHTFTTIQSSSRWSAKWLWKFSKIKLCCRHTSILEISNNLHIIKKIIDRNYWRLPNSAFYYLPRLCRRSMDVFGPNYSYPTNTNGRSWINPYAASMHKFRIPVHFNSHPGIAFLNCVTTLYFWVAKSLTFSVHGLVDFRPTSETPTDSVDPCLLINGIVQSWKPVCTRVVAPTQLDRDSVTGLPRQISRNVPVPWIDIRHMHGTGV